MENLNTSIKLARIIGPVMIAMAITEYKNFDIWKNTLPTVTYLNGALLFVAGLSIIQSHNVWTGWQTVITVIGWLVLVAGLLRMAFPTANQMNEGTSTIIVFCLMIILGVFLCYKGYIQKH